MKLTKAQKEALSVLAMAHASVRGSKRRSQRRPIETVNYIAAGHLVDLGLAEVVYLGRRFNAYSHDDRYQITREGRRVLREVS